MHDDSLTALAMPELGAGRREDQRLRRWQVGVAGLQRRGLTFDGLLAGVKGWLWNAADADDEPAWSVGGVGELDGTVTVEVSTLNTAAERRLRSAISEQRVTHFHPGAPHTIVSARMLDSTSWQDMIDAAATSTRRQWAVELVTPTTFRRGSKFHLSTDPVQLCNSGRSRWESLAPPSWKSLWPNQQCAIALMPTDWEHLHSYHFAIEVNDRRHVTRHVTASTGRVHYRCDDPAAAQRWEIAWRFFEMAGLGSCTHWGLGRIRLLPSWKQRTSGPVWKPQGMHLARG